MLDSATMKDFAGGTEPDSLGVPKKSPGGHFDAAKRRQVGRFLAFGDRKCLNEVQKRVFCVVLGSCSMNARASRVETLRLAPQKGGGNFFGR